MQQTDVAGDCKEKIVVERRQPGEFIFEHLRRRLSTLALLLYPSLSRFWEDFVRQLSQPVFEEGTDHVGVVQVVIGNEINVSVYQGVSRQSLM